MGYYNRNILLTPFFFLVLILDRTPYNDIGRGIRGIYFKGMIAVYPEKMLNQVEQEIERSRGECSKDKKENRRKCVQSRIKNGSHGSRVIVSCEVGIECSVSARESTARRFFSDLTFHRRQERVEVVFFLVLAVIP